MNKFIHFGCWNNLHSDKTNLIKVIEKINTLNLSDYDFISIAGDNYYPKREKIGDRTVKIFNEKELIKGFELLDNDIEKIVIHGNHDIEDIFVDKIPCIGLITYISRYSDKLNFFNKDIIHKKIINNLDQHILIIFFESTIYHMNTDKPINNTCYKYLDKFKDIRTVGEAIINQNKTINKIINENGDCDNILFICHHPIFSAKTEKDKNKIEINKKLINLYKFLNPKLKSKNVYHLCADLHLYQKGVIKIRLDNRIDLKINQIAVGTGGADLDNLPIKLNYKLNIDGMNLKYNIIEQRKNHGFSIINLNSDLNFGLLETTFIPIDIMHGGYNNNKYYYKYLKYKNKYIKLKK